MRKMLFLLGMIAWLSIPNRVLADVMEISADDGDLYEIINADTLADGTQAHEYLLTSTDKTYKMTGTITSKGDLTIAGEMGDDYRPPCIQSGVLADGSTVGTLFVLTGEESIGYFEDLYLLANATNGAASGVAIEVKGDNTVLEVYGCVFDGWHTFAIAYNGQWDSFYIHDNLFRNMVHPNQWYIGEVLRNTWPGEAYTDTVSMVGNVMIGINGYASAPVTKWYMDYFQFDDNAVLYTFKNPFFIFNMTEGTMNGNLFYGNYSGGVDRTEDPWWDNLWFPDTSFGVIALQPLSNDNAIMFDPDGDTSTVEGLAAIEAQRDIEISDNVSYWSTEVTDFWAAYNDTATNWIRTPVWMNDRTVDMFADDDAYPNLVEEGNAAENPGIPSEFDDAILHGTSSDGTGDIGLLDYFLQIRSGTAASDYWGFGYTTVEDAENWVPDWPLPEMMLLGDITSVDAPNPLPEHFALHQNYPNPFNPTTEISFSLNQESNVTLTIFNMLGQQVKELTSGLKSAGNYTLQWNGNDDLGRRVSSGIYLYTLNDGSRSLTKKMVLMK
ncbi:MAG TPA: T9SS type A sorting domain-containing protein [Candidatus Marinimicrobia bacterium]|nr:T9SS type A sorting domain-containing protein [Candidatus Neomarinimicrobiota bacterium]